MKPFHIFLIALLFIFVIGCESELIEYECYPLPLPEPDAGELILSTPGLKLSLAEEEVNINQNDVILVKIENLTDESIWLAKDYSIRLSEVIETNHYRRIDDSFIHDLEENTILEPNGGIGSITAFFVQPDIRIEEGSKQVHVFIWGNVMREDKYCTDKYGGAIIVTINP